MSQETLLLILVIVLTMTFIVQAAILFAVYKALGELRQAILKLQSDVEQHLTPMLVSVTGMVNAAREPLALILANLSEVTRLVRNRTRDADDLWADMLDRARSEIIRLDDLIATALSRIERAAQAVERGVMVPVREMTAIAAGIRRVLDVLGARWRRATPAERGVSEEQLFI